MRRGQNPSSTWLTLRRYRKPPSMSPRSLHDDHADLALPEVPHSNMPRELRSSPNDPPFAGFDDIGDSPLNLFAQGPPSDSANTICKKRKKFEKGDDSELIVCNRCQSRFHLLCIGLKKARKNWCCRGCLSAPSKKVVCK